MSFPANISLPTSSDVGSYYSIESINAYLRETTVIRIRNDAAKYKRYLIRGESLNHESISLEKLKDKLKIVLNGKVEKRKNSWANSINFNLSIGNDKAIASLIASLWRRTLSETSLKKAEKSQYGYMLNGRKCSKIGKEKEITALCEWCNTEITVSTIKGFACPCCGVYFHDLKPKKAKINYMTHEFSYEENYLDEINIIEKIKRGEISLEKTNYSRGAQPTLL